MELFMRINKYSWAVLLIILAGAADGASSSRKAYKSDLIVLSPELDSRRPLALTDYSGAVLESDSLFSFSEGGFAFKFDLETRTPRVWFPVGSKLSVPAVVQGQNVFLATMAGDIFSFNHDSGALNWKTRLDSYVVKRILISNGMLYFVNAGGNVGALEESSGEQKWLTQLINVSNLEVRETGAIAQERERLYVGARSTVEVFDVKSGERLGQYQTPKIAGKFGAVIGNIVFRADSVVFSRLDGFVFSFDKNKYGDLLWSRDLKSSISASLIENSIVNIGLSSGHFLTLDARSGKQLWKTEIGGAISQIKPVGSYLYGTTSDGLVVKLEKASGELVWIDHTQARMFSPPFVFENSIYFVSTMHNIYGYAL